MNPVSMFDPYKQTIADFQKMLDDLTMSVNVIIFKAPENFDTLILIRSIYKQDGGEVVFRVSKYLLEEKKWQP